MRICRQDGLEPGSGPWRQGLLSGEALCASPSEDHGLFPTSPSGISELAGYGHIIPTHPGDQLQIQVTEPETQKAIQKFPEIL